MELIRPCEEYLSQYIEAIREDAEFRPDSERIFRDPNKIIDQAYRFERGIDMPAGYVKETIFWLIDNERFIGQIGIRHELTEALFRYGGNIGYEIRYSECKKGYATKMLALALDYCKAELGLDRVLITCDDDNLGSLRVIEKNGGKLENKLENKTERGTVITRRYWIEL